MNVRYEICRFRRARCVSAKLETSLQTILPEEGGKKADYRRKIPG
jgi:hypothetical protein